MQSASGRVVQIVLLFIDIRGSIGRYQSLSFADLWRRHWQFFSQQSEHARASQFDEGTPVAQ